MRRAIIDLGTNTFNLLVADVYKDHFEVVHSEKEGVALGMGGINKNVLAPEAYQRGLRALAHFKSVCNSLNVEEIIGFGTSALRDAQNSQTFISDVTAATGIPIEIISGFREAELIYKGVKWSYDFAVPAVIMDIGGGSTEFIFADNKGINDLISLNIGVSRIYQQFALEDPLSQENITTIQNWLEDRSGGFFEGKEEHVLIGASGSFETFYELVHNEPFPEKIRSVEISHEFLVNCLEDIISSTQAQRDANPWIIPIRKKMAPIAAVKTLWVMKKLKTRRVFISPCSLKEGALSL